jgi:hypothetical protein
VHAPLVARAVETGLLRGQLRQDLVVGREATGFVLGVDALAIDDDIEDAVLAADQARLGARLLPDSGRQTGGPGQVVSTHAVGDLDLHPDSP